jgi:hypothetical protein
MYRDHFYNRSWFGRRVYVPFVGFGWFVMLGAAAWNHAVGGTPQPWAFPILLLGLVLFLVAKISVIRKGVLISFGQSVFDNATRPMKVAYALGWLLMIAGFILSFRPGEA